MSDIDGVECVYTSNGGGGDQGTTKMRVPRGIFIGRVHSVEVDNGTHVAKVFTKTHGGGNTAKVLMPFVNEGGLGLLAGIRKNARCLVLVTGEEAEFFVVGFFCTDPSALYGGPKIHSGDIHLASSGGAVISSMASGDINLHAHDLCGMSFFQEDQRITAIDRTFEHKHAGGREQWGEATEDGSDHSDGDTWRTVEVRRERGKPTTVKHMMGHVPNNELNTEVISQREVLDETGKQLLVEEIQTDGTITITHPNGARFRMEADGNVFVEPKSGGKIHMNDPNKTAQGAARKGDETVGHVHAISGTAGPFTFVGTIQSASDFIKDASTVVKIG